MRLESGPGEAVEQVAQQGREAVLLDDRLPVIQEEAVHEAVRPRRLGRGAPEALLDRRPLLRLQLPHRDAGVEGEAAEAPRTLDVQGLSSGSSHLARAAFVGSCDAVRT